MRNRPMGPVGKRCASWFPGLNLTRLLIQGRPRMTRGGHAPQQDAAAAPDPPCAPALPRTPHPDAHLEALTGVAWLETWPASPARLRYSTRRGDQGHLRCPLCPGARSCRDAGREDPGGVQLTRRRPGAAARKGGWPERAKWEAS